MFCFAVVGMYAYAGAPGVPHETGELLVSKTGSLLIHCSIMALLGCNEVE
jgi:hypothetical protein